MNQHIKIEANNLFPTTGKRVLENVSISMSGQASGLGGSITAAMEGDKEFCEIILRGVALYLSRQGISFDDALNRLVQ